MPIYELSASRGRLCPSEFEYLKILCLDYYSTTPYALFVEDVWDRNNLLHLKNAAGFFDHLFV